MNSEIDTHLHVYMFYNRSISRSHLSRLVDSKRLTFEPRHDKTNKVTVLPVKTDQPGHPPSLIRVFAVRMKKAWVLSYPLSAQRRLWSGSYVYIVVFFPSCINGNVFTRTTYGYTITTNCDKKSGKLGSYYVLLELRDVATSVKVNLFTRNSCLHCI